jgi:hypothetical protein
MSSINDSKIALRPTGKTEDNLWIKSLMTDYKLPITVYHLPYACQNLNKKVFNIQGKSVHEEILNHLYRLVIIWLEICIHNVWWKVNGYKSFVHQI